MRLLFPEIHGYRNGTEPNPRSAGRFPASGIAILALLFFAGAIAFGAEDGAVVSPDTAAASTQAPAGIGATESLTAGSAFATPSDTPAAHVLPPLDSLVVLPDAASDRALLDSLDWEWARSEDSLRREATAAASAGQNDSAVAPVVADPDAYITEGAAEGTEPGHGSLSGKVVSRETGGALADVRVIVAGRERSAFTDAEGRFSVADLAPGRVALLLTHAAHNPLQSDSLDIIADHDVLHAFTLEEKALKAEAVRISGRAVQASEAGMLFAQKNAPTVSDGISSEQMSKSGDGDAASAIKRVTGISIGGDGLVYVRGLGERYVNVQLNGLTLSSPNPEKRVIPLDMFPTGLIENMSVSKTFTADQPSEFAGGALQLRTKDYPDGPLLRVSASGGYEGGVTGGSTLTYDGGDWDWLGQDDGTRALPSSIPDESFDYRSPVLGATAEERRETQREMLGDLNNEWTPQKMTAPVNQSYGFALGNKVEPWEDGVFGWLVGANFGAKWGQDEEFNGRVKADTAGNVSYLDQFDKEISEHEVLWGLLGTATLEPMPGQKIRLNGMMNRQFLDEVERVYGQRESDNDTSLLYQLYNSQQTLSNIQLEGEHRFFGEDGFGVSWMGALTQAIRDEPDRRVSKYLAAREDDPNFDPDFPFRSNATQGLADRYWWALEENGRGAKLDFDGPLAVETLGWEEESRWRVGGMLFAKQRDFEVDRITYKYGNRLIGEPQYAPYEDLFELFNGSNDSGYIDNRNDLPKDDYSVEDLQAAWHVQADFDLPWDLRAILGVRGSFSHVDGGAVAPRGVLSTVEREAADCDENDTCRIGFGYDDYRHLPALSLVYGATETQNVRLAYSQTLSFPEYREMAPLLYFSYQQALETVGNFDLMPTLIHNYDARWEWFPRPGDLFALSGFYKYFEDPVEVNITQISSNYRTDFINAPSAFLYGLETEARVGLGAFVPALAPFQALGNFTWIYSEVDGKRKRAMQGQSPYLINAILFFEPEESPWQASVLYNRIGPRIAKVGLGTFPDIQDEARQSLEAGVSYNLGRGFKAKLSGKNLLAEKVQQTQGGLLIREYKTGRTFSLGISYAFR